MKNFLCIFILAIFLLLTLTSCSTNWGDYYTINSKSTTERAGISGRVLNIISDRDFGGAYPYHEIIVVFDLNTSQVKTVSLGNHHALNEVVKIDNNTVLFTLLDPIAPTELADSNKRHIVEYNIRTNQIKNVLDDAEVQAYLPKTYTLLFTKLKEGSWEVNLYKATFDQGVHDIKKLFAVSGQGIRYATISDHEILFEYDNLVSHPKNSQPGDVFIYNVDTGEFHKTGISDCGRIDMWNSKTKQVFHSVPFGNFAATLGGQEQQIAFLGKDIRGVFPVWYLPKYDKAFLVVSECEPSYASLDCIGHAGLWLYDFRTGNALRLSGTVGFGVYLEE